MNVCWISQPIRFMSWSTQPINAYVLNCSTNQVFVMKYSANQCMCAEFLSQSGLCHEVLSQSMHVCWIAQPIRFVSWSTQPISVHLYQDEGHATDTRKWVQPYWLIMLVSWTLAPGSREWIDSGRLVILQAVQCLTYMKRNNVIHNVCIWHVQQKKSNG